MAIDDHFVGGAGAGDGRRLCAGVLPQAGAPGLRPRAGIDGILRVTAAAAGTGNGLGDAAHPSEWRKTKPSRGIFFYSASGCGWMAQWKEMFISSLTTPT